MLYNIYMDNKPFILNVSRDDIIRGRHKFDRNTDTVLIQIVDPDKDFPTPMRNYAERHQFKFYDMDIPVSGEGLFCTEDDAKQIVSILKDSLRQGRNVIVHCTAGICRSGAVAEVGVMMGFEDGGAKRIPNRLVKYLLMKELGWTYD